MKMKNDQLLQVANEQIKSRKYRKWYYSVFVSLAVIVIFCTVYALILPAITMTTKQENTTPEPIPITGQISDLSGLGIYPGELREGGTWVAYDAESETNANVKAVITLPEGAAVTENCYPFIRKVNSGEAYYPTDAALDAAVGARNDMQCYMIHWVELNETAGTYNLQTNMEITDGKNATIQLEYLKSGARLWGTAGERKLRIFSSRATDGTELCEISDSVKKVNLDTENYKGFTFNVTQPCPYVFVSKKLEKGYVQQLTIESIVDGSAPFDNTGSLSADGTVDKPGNDKNDHNKVVRSYDTIQYNLAATFAARQNKVTEEKVKMYFELTLGKSATSARFDVSKMLWLGENYCIEYLDDQGEVVMIRAHDGKYYGPQRDENGSVVRDGSGFALADTSKPVSFNAQVNGSKNGKDSYKVSNGGVTQQRLVGWTELKAKEGDNILSGTQNFTAAVEVRNADNGEVFTPAFKIWLEGNEDNYGSESTEDNEMIPAQIESGNKITADGDKAVTVSAGTNFNIQLKKNTDMSYKNWFDFSTGQTVAADIRAELVRLASLPENHGKSNPAEFTDGGAALSAEKQAKYANYRYGRITCYGIALQLYNDTDNNPDENRAAKGLKGISLPVGDITFDLNFYSEVKSKDTSVSPNEYTAILWDYNENVPANCSYSYNYVDPGRGTVKTPNDGKGNGGRNLYWDGETRSPYAKGGAPSNYMVYHGGCYYGGDWAMTDAVGNKLTSLAALNQIASPTKVMGSGADTTYHFSVSDYDFDFDNQHFPLQDAGNSGNVTGYDTYARCFSAGCVQVLSVFPMVQKVSEAEVFLNTTVSNLQLKTRAGQELKADEGDSSKINHEVNKADNKKRDQIVLYAPGNLTKGNAFNGKHKGNPPNTTAEGFLGTEYWTTSYDCSAFAGDEIWIISYGMMVSGSDFRTRSMNLLQLFDSRALRIRGEPDVKQDWNPQFDQKGDARFLYAADPDHPEGYDTNKDGILAYMNTVREEDLVYSTSRPDADGNITVNGESLKCIGVLMELRHCDLLGGKYQYMRIPVKVNGNDEKLVGKTVATVNTFRVWSYDLGSTTWADGQWDKTTGKNTLTGYSVPQNRINADQYSGELANNEKSPPAYVKTEYQDGHQVTGTHAGGTLSGNSLLILNYEAHVNITVDNKGGVSSISYNQGNGETVVDYRLKNIKTEISDLTGQMNMPPTTLTVTAVLDEGLGSGQEQRISVSGGTYRISGYEVDADGKPTGEETDISIGTDPNNPVQLAFYDSDGNFHIIKVHAVLGANSRSVSFVIQDAPVGIQLPDITFKANFSAATALKENDKIKTNAYISGAGDNRAYDIAKGNMDNITVGVVLGSGTNLTKAVDVRYIELNGKIEYTVTYTNSGTASIDKIYFYDLLPATGDIRGSALDGKVILRKFDVKTKGSGSETPATVYYSTTKYKELYDKVKVFGGQMNGTAITGMNADEVEDMLKNGKNEDEGKLFEVLGTVTNGKFEYDPSLASMSDEAKSELMGTVTGLYVRATSLGGGQTITMTFTVETKDNQAGNLYKNISNSWIADKATLPLTSNMVETAAISRRISGVVWYDWNLNGVRDENVEQETPLADVTVTLFKKNGSGAYEICTTDVTGALIDPVITKADGAYTFYNLAAGDYIVAFSGEALKPYTAATTYQQNKVNDSDTNDGVAISELKADGIDASKYLYFIRHSVGFDSMLLHSIADMGSVTLNNGVEAFDHQDLGVIIAGYELPATGGSGTILYTTGGLLLMALSLVYGYRKNRRSERRMR